MPGATTGDRPTTRIEVPFLVVGAGPVGLVAARLLADAGHDCLVVERRDGPQRHPAAHVVNARTLEILRQAGFDMDAVHAVAKDPGESGHVNFVTRLDGELIGRLPFERQGDECLRYTPTPLRNISQHRLEPLLADAVAQMAGVDLRYGVEWRSAEQDAEGVTSVLVDLDGGEPIEVRSRYVLAADGAGSRVRTWLGIGMVGPARLQSFVAIHVAADLRAVVADRPGVLHFVMDPAAGGVFVAHDPGSEWVFMVDFDPDGECVEEYDDARCAAIVRRALGGVDVPFQVLGAGSWHMTAQVAERMRSDRVFLVGDAAHRFPPTGGLGLNTGVADAHDLAWKLDAVERGWGGSALLDTYDAERRPVACVNCEQSTSNAMRILELVDALGLVEEPTTERLHASLDDPGAAERIAAAVDAQATHFDMLGLQLGHVYADGALVREGEPPPTMLDPRSFEPDAAVGARLPHAWTADGRSTLDLVDPRVLTLLSAGEHDRWREAVRLVDAPVAHVRIGRDVLVDEGWAAVCRLGPGGALLVRPDHHVAWRTDEATAERFAALPDAVARVLA